MFYTIYKITNLINQKTYIGKHQTTNLDDDYMGSGKLIQRAIEKYGIECFRKEILHVFDNEAAMNAAEKDLVVINENSYNLCPGGHGGFGYINANLHRWKGKNQRARKLADKKVEEKYGPEWRTIIGKMGSTARNEMYPELSRTVAKRGHEEGWLTFKGRKHTPETLKLLKEKHKDIHKGERNSQYGTCWVRNEEGNKKIRKEELDKYLEMGYVKGRKM